MNMVEKVARAIVVFWGEDPDRATVSGRLMWEETAPLARAVIEVLREPTDDMIKAGQRNPSDGSWSSRKSTIGRHHAVIDEALKE